MLSIAMLKFWPRNVSAAALLLATCLGAQQPNSLTLESVLERLEANLNDYDTRVPSFFCDEHVVSRKSPGPRTQDTVTDSVFRLRRITNRDGTSALDESREVKVVNGHRAESQELTGPSIVSGAFEGGLAVVSLSQQECMRYTLERGRKAPAGSYVVQFETLPHPRDASKCLLTEPSKGEAVVDAATMQIAHLALRVPHHVISEGEMRREKVKAEWLLSVDYAPVTLEGRTFWMPSVIESHNTVGAGTFHPVVWSYTASYRNYHKLEVSSRIVPAGESDQPR